MPALAPRSLEVALLAALAGACGGPPAPSAPVPGQAPPARAAASARAAGAHASGAPDPAAARPGLSPGRPCGELDCRAFATPRLAFERALAGSPRVVAVGEAHAQKAVPGVDSAAVRFARDLLPALAPRVTGVVLELLAPDRRCEAHEEQAVAERTKPITEPQRDTNQSEFLALGFEAKKLGMKVEPLIPTCDELENVLAASNDVDALLRLIARVTEREVFDFLEHQKPEHGILIYGGLVHNDLAPAPGRAPWSYGPAVAEHAGGSYAEIDLIVPELVRNEPPWTELSWFSHYRFAQATGEALLYSTGPRSFVLIFPPAKASEPAKASQ